MPGKPSEPIATQYPEQMIGPWGVAALAISQAQVALKLGVNDATTGSNLNTGIPMPYAGSIIGILEVLNVNKTAGALSVSPTINGAEVASTVSLYRVAMGNAVKTAQKLVDADGQGLRFNQGDLLGAKVTSDALLLPAASADLHVYLLVIWDYVTP